MCNFSWGFFTGWSRGKERGQQWHPQERILPPLTQLAQPTQTNKQHCLFRSRVWALFHVFHQVAHLHSGTSSLSLSLSRPLSLCVSLCSICENKRNDETVFPTKAFLSLNKLQAPYRGKHPAGGPAKRRPHRHWHTTAPLKTDINYTLHTRLYEWIICNSAVGSAHCFCADFTSKIERLLRYIVLKVIYKLLPQRKSSPFKLKVV